MIPPDATTLAPPLAPRPGEAEAAPTPREPPGSRPEPAPVPDAPPLARSRAARAFYLALGLVCVPIAFAGFWLPLVPGTVFLIVAAWAFARSSPRLEAWLLAHEKLGPVILAWRRSQAIPRGVKLFSVGSMAVSMGVMLAVGAPLFVLLVGGVACAASAGFILTRPDA